MERTLSAEERIRRAEEIYYKRKMQSQGVRVSTNTSNKKIRADYKLFYKIIIQVLICIVIYVIFYLVQNSNYIFSEDLINSTKGILSYDINFQKVYKEISGYITNIKGENSDENNKASENENPNENNNIENEATENQTEQNPLTEENIGGAENTNIVPEDQNAQNDSIENSDTQNEENSNEGLSQMEIDANYIKSKYSLIKPITGTITSRFGPRNPTTSSVPKNHTGIDIAANSGTAIHAALDGVVKIASSEGDYGKHLRIEKDDIAIYYAHCSKLCVEEGQHINQGDVIAEVGATRKCNRPSLTF